MAKRLTDTGKWKKQWYRKLPPKMKSAWEYLCDNCDHAGVWDTDFETLSFNVGEAVSAEECERYFTPKRFLRITQDKYFLPGFLVFQYGETIYVSNNTHLSALKILERYGITTVVRGPWKIDRTTDKKNRIEPELITTDPDRVRAIMDSVLKRMSA